MAEHRVTHRATVPIPGLSTFQAGRLAAIVDELPDPLPKRTRPGTGDPIVEELIELVRQVNPLSAPAWLAWHYADCGDRKGCISAIRAILAGGE